MNFHNKLLINLLFQFFFLNDFLFDPKALFSYQILPVPTRISKTFIKGPVKNRLGQCTGSANGCTLIFRIKRLGTRQLGTTLQSTHTSRSNILLRRPVAQVVIHIMPLFFYIVSVSFLLNHFIITVLLKIVYVLSVFSFLP